jgi:hypothetical protein
MPAWLKTVMAAIRKRGAKRPASRRQGQARLQVEALEERLVLTTPSFSPMITASDPTVQLHAINGTAPPSNAYVPIEIRRVYGFDQIGFLQQQGYNKAGQGQTIAIVDAGDNPNAWGDLQEFDQQFDLPDPPSFRQVGENNNFPIPAPGVSNLPQVADEQWSQEIAGDVEWAHAIAPAANILLVEANSANPSDLLAAVDYAASQPGVVAVSMSFGDATSFNEPQDNAHFTTPGVTFVAASMDSSIYAYPSGSPNVLSVGGTTLNIDQATLSIASETAWSGSGSGQDPNEAVPPYQAGLGLYSRNTPDVAYDADPSTPFAVYDSSYDVGWTTFRGTSAGAPQWAALIAIADQGRAAEGLTPLTGGTQTLPTLYNLPASDFNYIPGPGGAVDRLGNSLGGAPYSLVTGLGSPRADRIVAGLDALPAGMTLVPNSLPLANIQVGGTLMVSAPAGGTVVVDQAPVSSGVPGVQVTVNGQIESFYAGVVGDVEVAPGPGQHAVQINAVPQGVSVHVTSAGYDAVTLGNGSVQGIQGPVFIANPPAYTILTIDDSADPIGRSVLLTESGIAGLSPAGINYQQADLLALNVYGGSGTNTFTVSNTPANPFVTTTLHSGRGFNAVSVLATTGPLHVVGGGYGDQVNVGHNGSVQGIRGAVSVTNPPSYTALSVDDSFDGSGRAVSVTNASITGLAPAVISYQQYDLESLTVRGGYGGNGFTVNSTPGGWASTAIDTGDGSDTVVMGNGPVGWLTLNGGAGGNTLNYARYTGNVEVNLLLGTATGVSGGVTSFQDVVGGLGNNLLVSGGPGEVLIGGAGRNLLIDGYTPTPFSFLGSPYSRSELVGGTGDNLIIGESVAYGRNQQALDALFAEWTRADETAAQRMAHLRWGGGLNGSYVLNGSTVSGVGDQDTLVGGAGLNWFLADTSDWLAFSHPTDQVN